MTPTRLEREAARLKGIVEAYEIEVRAIEAAIAEIKNQALKMRMVRTELAEAKQRLADAKADLDSILAIEAAKRLPFAERSAKVEGQDMTAAQTLRRGNAIAKAHAEKTGDAFQMAVTTSEWHSQARYAKQRLKISPSTLSEYRKGVYPTPRKIAEKAEKDLGIAPDKANWPGGIVD